MLPLVQLSDKLTHWVPNKCIIAVLAVYEHTYIPRQDYVVSGSIEDACGISGNIGIFGVSLGAWMQRFKKKAKTCPFWRTYLTPCGSEDGFYLETESFEGMPPAKFLILNPPTPLKKITIRMSISLIAHEKNSDKFLNLFRSSNILLYVQQLKFRVKKTGKKFVPLDLYSTSKCQSGVVL